jgi:hypothetical protein
VLQSTPILGPTRVPCLATESSAKAYPPHHKVCTYIVRFRNLVGGVNDFVKFGIWVFLVKRPSNE